MLKKGTKKKNREKTRKEGKLLTRKSRLQEMNADPKGRKAAEKSKEKVV